MQNDFLNFQNAYIDDCGGFYVSSNKCNGLFYIYNGENRMIGLFPNKDRDIQYLHKSVLKFERKLFFIPTWGTSIDIFDMDSETFETVSFEEENIGLTTTDIVINNNIVFLPRNLNDLVCVYRIEERCFEKLNWLNRKLREIKKEYGSSELFYVTLYEGKIYAPLRNTNIILIIDISLHEVKTIFSKIKEITPYSIDIKDGIAWITQEYNSSLIIWDIKNDIWNSIAMPKIIEKKVYIPYVRIFFCENKVIVVSRNSGKIIVYDKEIKESLIIDIKKMIDEDKEMKSTVWFYGGRLEDNRIILYPSRTNKIVEINLNNYSVNFMETGDIDKTKLFRDYLRNDCGITVENSYVGLSTFLDCI